MGNSNSKTSESRQTGSSGEVTSPSRSSNDDDTIPKVDDESLSRPSRLQLNTTSPNTHTQRDLDGKEAQSLHDPSDASTVDSTPQDQRIPSDSEVEKDLQAKLSSVAGDHQKELERLRSNHAEEMRAKNGELKAEVEQKEAQQERCLREFASFHAGHEQDIVILEAEHQKETQALMGRHQNDITALYEHHRRLIAQNVTVLQENQALKARSTARDSIVDQLMELNSQERKVDDDASYPGTKRTKQEHDYAPPITPPIIPPFFMPPWITLHGVPYINLDTAQPSPNPTPNEARFAKKLLRNYGEYISHQKIPGLCNDPDKNRGRVKRGMWIWVPDSHPHASVSLASDDYVTSWIGDIEVKMRLMYVLRVVRGWGQYLWVVVLQLRRQGPEVSI